MYFIIKYFIPTIIGAIITVALLYLAMVFIQMDFRKPFTFIFLTPVGRATIIGLGFSFGYLLGQSLFKRFVKVG